MSGPGDTESRRPSRPTSEYGAPYLPVTSRQQDDGGYGVDSLWGGPGASEPPDDWYADNADNFDRAGSQGPALPDEPPF